MQHDPRFIIVMGVAGSGKTTIGRGLAARLGVPFHDGDDFHPPANIAKMAAGVPLQDEDRAGWLVTLAVFIRDGLARGQSGVIACSALKKKYRDILRVDARRGRFVYLQGDHDAIRARMRQHVGRCLQRAVSIGHPAIYDLRPHPELPARRSDVAAAQRAGLLLPGTAPR